MNVFELRNKLIEDYSSFAVESYEADGSFIPMQDWDGQNWPFHIHPKY